MRSAHSAPTSYTERVKFLKTVDKTRTSVSAVIFAATWRRVDPSVITRELWLTEVVDDEDKDFICIEESRVREQVLSF